MKHTDDDEIYKRMAQVRKQLPDDIKLDLSDNGLVTATRNKISVGLSAEKFDVLFFLQLTEHLTNEEECLDESCIIE